MASPREQFEFAMSAIDRLIEQSTDDSEMEHMRRNLLQRTRKLNVKTGRGAYPLQDDRRKCLQVVDGRA